jgi:hypothetical protein
MDIKRVRRSEPFASGAKGRLQNFIKIEYRKAFEKMSKAFLLHSIDMTSPV